IVPSRGRGDRLRTSQHIGCMNELQQRELLSLSNQQLADLVQSFAQAPYRLRQLLDGLYRQRWSRLDQFATLPLTFRQQLVYPHYSIGQPIIEKQFTSSDGTVRYLFAFADGQSVETVWMPDGDGGEAGDGSDTADEELVVLSQELSSRGRPATERPASAIHCPLTTNHSMRATICVSSQVGCAVECAFCMTALLGLHRNLTAGEIVGQVVAVLNDQQVEIERDRINLVFISSNQAFLTS